MDGLLQNIYYKVENKDNPSELPDKLQVWDVFQTSYNSAENMDYKTKIKSIQTVADYMNTEYIPNGCNLNSSEVGIMLYQNKDIRNQISDILQVPSYGDTDLFYDTFYRSCMKLSKCLYPTKTSKELQTTENLKLCVSETSTAYFGLTNAIRKESTITDTLNGENIFMDWNLDNGGFDLLVDINLIWKVMFKWEQSIPETLFFEMPKANNNSNNLAGWDQTNSPNFANPASNYSSTNGGLAVKIQSKQLDTPNTRTISAIADPGLNIVKYVFWINDKKIESDQNYIWSLTITENTAITVDIEDGFGQTGSAKTLLTYQAPEYTNTTDTVNSNIPTEVIKAVNADNSQSENFVNPNLGIQAGNPCVSPSAVAIEPNTNKTNLLPSLQAYANGLDMIKNNLVPNLDNRTIQNPDPIADDQNTKKTLAKSSFTSPNFAEQNTELKCEDSCSDTSLSAQYQNIIQNVVNNVINRYQSVSLIKSETDLNNSVDLIRWEISKIWKNVLKDDESNATFDDYNTLKWKLDDIKTLDRANGKSELIKAKSDILNVLGGLQSQSSISILTSNLKDIFIQMSSTINTIDFDSYLSTIQTKLSDIKKDLWWDYNTLTDEINKMEKMSLEGKKNEIKNLKNNIFASLDAIDSPSTISQLAKDRTWPPDSRQRESCTVNCCMDSCNQTFDKVQQSIEQKYNDQKTKITDEYDFKKKYSDQIYNSKLSKIDQDQKSAMAIIEAEYQKKLENGEDIESVRKWYLGTTDQTAQGYETQAQNIKTEWDKISENLRKRYDDNLWEITKNMTNEISKVNDGYGNRTNRAVCLSQCMCGQISGPLQDGKLDELSKSDRSPQISYKVKFCRIPVEVQSIVPKSVRTVEEILEEVNIVLNNLKESWQLTKSVKTKETLDTSMAKIKFADVLAFNFFIKFKPIFQTINSTQVQNTRKENNKTREKEFRKTYGDLEFTQERNKYLIKSKPEIFDASSAPATNYEISMQNISNKQKELDALKTDNSLKLLEWWENIIRWKMSDEVNSFVWQNGVFWSQIIETMTAMNDVANNLKMKIEK